MDFNIQNHGAALMARLIVRLQPNPASDPAQNVLRSQPGDVVDICEDAHVFTDAEYRLYLVINVPGVPASEFDHLKNPEFDADNEIMNYRTVKLDRVALDAEIARIRANLRGPLSNPDIAANTKART